MNRLATAANADKAEAYTRLEHLGTSSPGGNTFPAQQVQDELDRLARERPTDIAALMCSCSLATTTVPAEYLAAVVQEVLQKALLSNLPDSAVYLLEVDQALSFRYAATRVLLQIQDDLSLISQRPGQHRNGLIFNSGRGLFSDTAVGLAAYLSPLFLSLSPWVWAIGAPRPGGVVIYTFGGPVVGRRGEAAELLQLFLPTGRAASGPGPQVSAEDIDAALTWWVSALDLIFTEITDPARYQVDADVYDTRRNFEVLLSVEQAFRNVQSLSAHDRDSNARRVLLFDTLDTLEGLRLSSFDTMRELTHARRTLAQLEDRLDSAAARVLRLRRFNRASSFRHGSHPVDCVCRTSTATTA